MTVCVAAINTHGEIVSASDHMLSMADGAFTAESVALKDAYLHADWRAMFAADDVGIIPSLLRRIRAECPYEKEFQVEEMTALLSSSFQAERRARAVEQHLGTFDMSLEQFLSNGENVFGEAGAAIIRERLDGHRLRCELLVSGHDGPRYDKWRRAHLLSVSDPGIVKDHGVAGYWAVGTGWYLALSSLAMRGQSTRINTNSMVFNVCEAKFLAESAVGVGQETFVTVHRPNRSWASVGKDHLLKLRKEWIRVGKPRASEKSKTLVANWATAANWHDGPTAIQSSNDNNSSTDQT